MSFASILHPTSCIRTFVSFAIVSASDRKQGGEALGSNFISVLTNYRQLYPSREVRGRGGRFQKY